MYGLVSNIYNIDRICILKIQFQICPDAQSQSFKQNKKTNN